MKSPLQIVFRNMKRSPWAEELILKRVSKLDSLYDQIISCRVVVEIPHKHHQQGNFFLVRIKIAVPGKEIIVNQESREHNAYEDIHAAFKDAFDSAKRQLEDYVRLKRGDVKTHAKKQRQHQLVTPAPSNYETNDFIGSDWSEDLASNTLDFVTEQN